MAEGVCFNKIAYIWKRQKNKLSQISFDDLISQPFRDLPIFGYSICNFSRSNILHIRLQYLTFLEA